MITTMFRRIAVVALCAMAAGAGTVAGQSARRSENVQAVDNGDVGAAPMLWTVPAKPVLSIGSAEGDEAYQLYRVVGAVLLRDGSVAIANAGSSEIRIYDAAGRYTRTFGRSGGGPGEFRSLGGLLLLPGDTLVAYDSRDHEVSYFDPAKGFVRGYRLNGTEGGFPQPVGALSDGRLTGVLPRVYNASEVLNGLFRDSAEYVVFDAQGEQAASLGRFPGSESFVHGDGRSVSSSDVPFGHQTFAATAGAHIIVADNARESLDIYDPSGKVVAVVRARYPTISVTKADIAATKQRLFGNMKAAASPALQRMQKRMEDNFDKTPVPEDMAPYRSLHTDLAGDMWIELARHVADKTPTWVVFGPDGKLRGRVRTPPDVTILFIGKDRLVGRWRDDLEVEHVGVFPLRAAG